MRGRQASAVAIEDQARQQTRRPGAAGHRPLAPTGSEPVLNSLPKFWLDDRLVLSGVDFLLVRDVAPIKPVLQHQVNRAARERLGAPAPSRRLLTTPARSSSAFNSATEPSKA